MIEPRHWNYVDLRRKGVPALEAWKRSKTMPPAVCGWSQFTQNPGIARQPDRPHYAWIENTSAAGLRLVDYADKLAPRSVRHQGWYLDSEFQDEVYRGAVWRLPHSRGLIAGYCDPNNDGAAFVEIRLIDADDTVGAAHAADRIAELEAEKERDYQDGWRAGDRWRTLGEEIASLRRECLDLILDIKAACPTIADKSAITTTLRRRVEDIRHAITTAHKARKSLQNDYGHTHGFADAVEN